VIPRAINAGDQTPGRYNEAYDAERKRPNWNFSINPGEDVMLEDPGKDGKLKNTLIFKGTGLRT
jgi:hypothetical protein